MSNFAMERRRRNAKVQRMMSKRRLLFLIVWDASRNSWQWQLAGFVYFCVAQAPTAGTVSNTVWSRIHALIEDPAWAKIAVRER